ncbi:hypothetical protein CTAYLR_008080 [Chrysophaeum taylorii]|uniref:Gfo/Idh/MocA-like oxidoreductase N-terminal domain-containing protein n=1 Tax=Chrysophaeum taylorii TaxID=2483200 RepID=A0AAD7ULY2_9STRA|nr:hypothetical protein CTAYLR_008080 [Chrysophaeum taylorii]
MGWFHALQVVEGVCPSARLSDVVEPWFLGGGKASAGGTTFEKDVVVVWTPKGVAFHETIGDALFAGADGPTKIALVAGRTVDNPKLFRAAIKAGATHVLLEKPGAPTVAELEAMAAEAKAANVPVFMGFIKNIAAYVTDALAARAKDPGATVLLESRNDYTKETLAECFSRNSEGLLKNMAVHELALAAQFFGMRADNITSVDLDADGCECLTLGGHTDFSRVDFTLFNDQGTRVRIKADRCSGDGCRAVVAAADGTLLYTRDLVDEAKAKQVQARMKEHPDWLGYLITQEAEYAKLKELCAEHALKGTTPPNVATIEIGIEALKLAEYLTPVIKAKLGA